MKEKTLLAQIGADEVCVKVQCEHGESIAKTISYDEFLKLLLGNTYSKMSPYRLGVPEGTYDVMYTEPGEFSLVQIIDAQVFPVHYLDKVYEIPFPRLAFLTRVHGKKIVKTCVFALKKGKVSDETPLYNYPFGNVYDDGDICWGGNNINTNGDALIPRDVAYLPGLFLSAGTNSDLWRRDRVSVPKDTPPLLSSLYETLSHMDLFSESWLVETTYRVKDLFK